MKQRAAIVDRARRAASVQQRSLLFSNGTPAYQFNAPQWSTSGTETYRRAFASQVAVYRCVLVRATAVAEAHLKVFKEVDGDAVEQSKHSLRYLFARPNPTVSEAEFHAMTLTFMDACGFAAIEKVRAAAGNVVELWHLRPDWIKRVPRNQAPDDYEYHVPGRAPITIKAQDIFIVPGGPSTDLSPFGMSPMAAALREIGINDSTTDYLKLFLDGGAVPRHALVMPQEIKKQEEADRIKDRWREAYGGFHNWTNIALLHGGMDVKQIGTNLDDMAYPQLRALTETRICAAFGVPAIVAGIQAGLEASTYSNYEQARKAFFEDTISPLWKRLAGAYERALLFEATSDPRLSLSFDTSNVKALQEDIGAVWNRAATAARDGLITINQFQSAVGLPGFADNGDVLYLPVSAQPTRPEDLGKLADAEPEAPIVAVDDKTVDDLGDIDADPDEPDIPAVDDLQDDARMREVYGVTLWELREGGYAADVIMDRAQLVPIETRNRIARNHRIAVTKLAARHAPLIRQAFIRQGEKVIAGVAKRAADLAVETRDAEGNIVGYEARDLNDIDWQDADNEILRAILDLYTTAGKSAYTSVRKDVGKLAVDWSLSNPRVRMTQRELARRIVGVNQTTKNDVARLVVDGIEEGLRPEQIADNLRGLFAETYRNRSLTIARTEGQVGYNISTADAYKESGRVLAMTLHDNPAHTEPYGAIDGLSCAQRNGLITDVDKAGTHIYSEHPNGTLAAAPLLVRPLGTSS